jgi:hypothetical protein
MKCPDVKELSRTLRNIAIDLRASSAEVTQTDFLRSLRERLANITPEQMLYGFERFAWAVGRHALKDVQTEAERRRDPAQLTLPMSMAGLKIPLSLPIDRPDGRRVCVTTHAATLEDCDLYDKGLVDNIRACTVRRLHFGEMMKDVRPVLVANPGWNVGMALEFLRDQERSAA